MNTIPDHKRIGLAVWVKYSGWPWWPALVIRYKDGLRSCSNKEKRRLPNEGPNNTMVRFFEESDDPSPVAVVEAKNVREFVASFRILIKSSEKNKGKIRKSVKKAAEWIRNCGLPSQKRDMQVLIRDANENVEKKRLLKEEDEAHEKETLRTKRRKQASASKSCPASSNAVANVTDTESSNDGSEFESIGKKEEAMIGLEPRKKEAKLENNPTKVEEEVLEEGMDVDTTKASRDEVMSPKSGQEPGFARMKKEETLNSGTENSTQNNKVSESPRLLSIAEMQNDAKSDMPSTVNVEKEAMPRSVELKPRLNHTDTVKPVKGKGILETSTGMNVTGKETNSQALRSNQTLHASRPKRKFLDETVLDSSEILEPTNKEMDITKNKELYPWLVNNGVEQIQDEEMKQEKESKDKDNSRSTGGKDEANQPQEINAKELTPVKQVLPSLESLFFRGKRSITSLVNAGKHGSVTALDSESGTTKQNNIRWGTEKNEKMLHASKILDKIKENLEVEKGLLGTSDTSMKPKEAGKEKIIEMEIAAQDKVLQNLDASERREHSKSKSAVSLNLENKDEATRKANMRSTVLRSTLQSHDSQCELLDADTLQKTPLKRARFVDEEATEIMKGLERKDRHLQITSNATGEKCMETSADRSKQEGGSSVPIKGTVGAFDKEQSTPANVVKVDFPISAGELKSECNKAMVGLDARATVQHCKEHPSTESNIPAKTASTHLEVAVEEDVIQMMSVEKKSTEATSKNDSREDVERVQRANPAVELNDETHYISLAKEKGESKLETLPIASDEAGPANEKETQPAPNPAADLIDVDAGQMQVQTREDVALEGKTEASEVISLIH